MAETGSEKHYTIIDEPHHKLSFLPMKENNCVASVEKRQRWGSANTWVESTTILNKREALLIYRALGEIFKFESKVFEEAASQWARDNFWKEPS